MIVSFRYFRLYKPLAPSTFAINEIQFYGVLVYNTGSVDASCPLQVFASPTSIPVNSTTFINYKDSLTSLLTKVDPKYGTTLGGVNVTLTGTNFGNLISDISVLIDGVSCKVFFVSSTRIDCTTGARLNYVKPSLTIYKNNSGFVSTQGLLFIYADLWSDHRTWGGEVPPRDGETVQIPAGMNILLDVPTGKLNAVLIEGSLTVLDTPGITIDAHYIFVYGGSLTIGTEEAPYLNDITITIYGNTQSPTLPNYGNKFIGIRDGVLDIHGAPKTPSWTLLADTANPGDTTITLQQSVNWKAGDKIVIATTTYSLENTEVMTIASVNAQGTAITLTAPLKYQHYAKTETYGDDTIDIRAEVGCLTRNIKIKGDIDPTDPLYGVHIMLFSPGDESSVGRIENLEIFNAGQAYNLGRYPIHFHLIGRVTQSYIRNCAIHDTFNRATTVHGVYYLTISNNVAYNVMGHTFFIEDGIEQQNTISGNLGVNTRASYSLLDVDMVPAVYWITNPTNFVLNNHAAGCESYGFWYSLFEHPTGPSADNSVWPEFMPLGQFKNNTAHSLARYGLRIFHRFFPSSSPGDPIANYSRPDWWNVSNVPVPALFENFTAWKCQLDGAITEDTGDVRFINFKVADNLGAGIEFTYTHWTRWYQTTRLQNALIIGNSGNTENANNGTVGLLTSQTDGLFVDGAKFFNFNNGQFPLGDESHSFKSLTRDTGARLTKLQGLKFTNSHKKILWNIPNTGIFQILDDSLTGTTGDFAVAYWNHLLGPNCTDNTTDYNSIICTNGTTVRRVAFYNLSPFSVFNVLNIIVSRISGDGIPVYVYPNGTATNDSLWSAISMQKGGKNKNPTFA